MKILFFTLLSLWVSSFVLGMVTEDDKLSHFSYELNKATLSGFLIYCIICIIKMDEPTAMDVYQGRTTLEITYKDGVPIDSVVVLKKAKGEQQ